jgi:hypothetical protein
MQAFFQSDLDQVGAKKRNAGKSGLARFETDDRRPTCGFASERYDEN